MSDALKDIRILISQIKSYLTKIQIKQILLQVAASQVPNIVRIYMQAIKNFKKAQEGTNN